jgi:hypothetical protein
MKKIFFLLMIFTPGVLFPHDAIGIKIKNPVFPAADIIAPDLDARIIDLVNETEYVNKSSIDIREMQQHITIPSYHHDYQLLLRIQGQGFFKQEIVRHKNTADEYLKLLFNLPANKSVSVKTVFRILLIPVDYNRKLADRTISVYPDEARLYLRPSQNIESDSELIVKQAQEIKKIAAALLIC